MIEFLISKGCTVDKVGYIDKRSSLLVGFIQSQNHKAMKKVLSYGLTTAIYNRRFTFANGRYCMQTVLDILVTHVTTEDNNNKKGMAMFIDFCQYILSNCDQVGGESKVINHIVDTQHAAGIILKLEKFHPLRQQFLLIATKYSIDTAKYTH